MKHVALLASSLAMLTIVAGCHRNNANQSTIQVATVTRRDITVTAQATGTVEPIDTVAVKAQASGLITVMPVDIGSHVKPGDLLAQIDTRTLTNDYQRAVAAQQAARATLTIDSSALARANTLYQQRVITADEHEGAVVAEANARAALTAARMTTQTAAQNLAFATVKSEVSGTVISKSASVGTVVSSAISTYGGGSTILTIADLTRVRMRALVNETDVGNVRVGMPVTVTVDAFPNRTFHGVVERVEPQATVQNSVTMFPVLVSLQNVDQALLPGMNGEVVIVTQQRNNVLAVPNDAIRTSKDLAAAATALGVTPDSALAMARANRPPRPAPESSAARGDTGGAGRGRAGGGNGGGGGFGGAGGNNAQFVFVKTANGWVPHFVRTGASDFDYSEVLSGVQEGDQVALLGAALIQAQRNAQTERIRSITGNGLPGTGGGAARGTGQRSGTGGNGARSGPGGTSGNSSSGASGGASSGNTRGSGAAGGGGNAPPPPPQ